MCRLQLQRGRNGGQTRVSLPTSLKRISAEIKFPQGFSRFISQYFPSFPQYFRIFSDVWQVPRMTSCAEAATGDRPEFRPRPRRVQRGTDPGFRMLPVSAVPKRKALENRAFIQSAKARGCVSEVIWRPDDQPSALRIASSNVKILHNMLYPRL